jgi:crotonyl-CoA carboxylase/reductase
VCIEMTLFTDAASHVNERQDIPEFYPIGQRPPLGSVPRLMHAWTLRPDGLGHPSSSFKQELVPVPACGDDEVLVFIMAAGINYNGVWAATGYPVSVFEVHNQPYHIAGSDAAGIVYKVGKDVHAWKIGDEVIIHCNINDYDDVADCAESSAPLPKQRIWGYETNLGAFAQYTVVKSQQLLPKPPHHGWAKSACYLLKLSTAYRMLLGHPPHNIKPGSNVLVWGGAGGLGSFAIQLCRLAEANAIAVVSKDNVRDYLISLGAKGIVNRTHFNCWGRMPEVLSPAYEEWYGKAKLFGGEIWKHTGKGNNVDISFEHPGEDTFSVSCFVTKRGGMIVFCAGTTGYNFTFDARYIWMNQKRIQGSHSASIKQANEANQLVLDGKIDPCLSQVFEWSELPQAHQLMYENAHKPGNMAVYIGSPRDE